jgi:hypothetical protein
MQQKYKLDGAQRENNIYRWLPGGKFANVEYATEYDMS